MIFVFLIVMIVALVFANIFVAALKPKKNPQRGFLNPGNEVYTEKKDFGSGELESGSLPSEEKALLNGSIASMNQKVELMGKRTANLERAVSALAKNKTANTTPQKENSYNTSNEKKRLKDLSEFKEDAKIRIEVLEKEVEKMKGKPLSQKKQLEKFDDKTEEKIRSLVYNTRKN